MKLFYTGITACLLLFLNSAFAQKKSVVIGDMINRPNALLILNSQNHDQGFLLPQLSSSERISISPTSPDDDGLMVFDNTEKSLYYWKNSQWSKLSNSDITQALGYDASTNILSLTGAGTADLSSLKEIPSQSGQAGKFLTTDGTVLAWATTSSISSIVAGAAITATTAAGQTTVGVNVDNATISVNGTNQLQLSPNAVSVSNIKPGTNNTVMTTTATGQVQWLPLTPSSQTLALAGNLLSISGGNSVDLTAITAGGQVSGPLNNLTLGANTVTSTIITDGTIATNDLANNSVTSQKITDGSVTSTKLANTTVTAGTYGTSTSVPQLTVDSQGRITGVTNTTITGAAPTGAAGGDLTGNFPNPTIAGNVITPAKMSAGDYSSKINSGTYTINISGNAATATNFTGALAGDVTGPQSATVAARLQGKPVSATAPTSGQILKWNGAAWAPAADANAGGTVTSVATGTGLAGGPITGTGTISLANTAVTPGSYGDATHVSRIDVDAQGRITNATAVVISGVTPAGTAGGALTGSYPNPTVANGAITSTNLAVGDYSSKITSGTYGINITGNATSATSATTFTGPLAGDVTGNQSSTVVTQLQGRSVSATAPSANQILKWNGSAWAPAADANGGGTVTSVGTGTGLTGGPITGTGTIALANTAVTPGTYGDATHVSQMIVDAQGRITSASNVTVAGTVPGGTAGGDLSGSYPNPTLATNAVTPAKIIAGDYSSKINSGTYSINISGNAATATNFSGVLLGDVTGPQGATVVNRLNGNAVSSATPATGEVMAWSGSSWGPQSILFDNTTIIGNGSTGNRFRIAPGTPNQILSTNASSVVQWIDKSTLGSSFAVSGDVTGTLAATTVQKLQGVNVASAAPADKNVLQYDQGSGQWRPTAVTAISNNTGFKSTQTFQQPLLGTVMILWNTSVYDDGGNFGTNQYVAPSAGLYHFDATVAISNFDKQQVMEIILRVNGVDAQRVMANTGQTDEDISASLSTDTKLSAGDRVTIWVQMPVLRNTMGQGVRTQFSGRKVY